MIPVRGRMAFTVAIGIAVLGACGGEDQTASRSGPPGAVVKGGDDRTGEYEAVWELVEAGARPRGSVDVGRSHPITREAARANPHPGPYTYGDPAVLAFLPDGSFLLGDGYWNTRIVKYDADGEYLMEWGELGSGPGQFDLVHGVAVDRDHRVYVGDRTNNRIQVFTEDGEFIEEWLDITDPVRVFADENDAIWVISATLNRILKYNRDGELQYYLGAFGGTRGGFPGGLSRPHQLDVDQEGNLYIASWDGGWVDKLVPRTGADPSRLIGRSLVLPS